MKAAFKEQKEEIEYIREQLKIREGRKLRKNNEEVIVSKFKIFCYSFIKILFVDSLIQCWNLAAAKTFLAILAMAKRPMCQHCFNTSALDFFRIIVETSEIY